MSRISNNLIVNGKPFSDFGVYVTSRDTYNAPERDEEIIEVKGRNGSLTIDHGRYKNISVSYPCVIVDNFQDNIDMLRNFLQSIRGYVRIEDDFHPHEYRMGRISSGFSLKPNIHDDASTFEIIFDCKPQRFLKSGEQKITITTTGAVIRNPTLEESKPLIRAYGTGTLTINGETITVNSANEYTDIDCEMQSCYKGSTNCNGNVTMTTGEFFTLASGNNTVTFTGFTSLEIIPKWWRV